MLERLLHNSALNLTVKLQLILCTILEFNILDINECTSNPCFNGATCNDLVNGYSCSCVPGWTGTICNSGI